MFVCVVQVLVVITRHVSSLRKIYQFYSRLGFEESLDNTFSLSRMQFWRFAKDCHFHHSGKTLMEMDRYIGKCEYYIMHALTFCKHVCSSFTYVYDDVHANMLSRVTLLFLRLQLLPNS